MATTEPTSTLILGITLKDAITAILIPIVAVLTTLVVQDRQQQRDRRMQILRMLMATRHLPADAQYNASINLIPVEFHRISRIMNAWRAYIAEVRFKPAPGNEQAHYDQCRTKQTKLISAIMTKMGIVHSEADIHADAYASQGFVERDNLYLDSLQAARDAANALKGVADAMRVQVELLLAQTGVTPSKRGSLPTDEQDPG